jgi:sRNA-binding carbon storage regulator CsrA
MALVLTLSGTKDPSLTITHEGETCQIKLDDIRIVRGSPRVKLIIDAPQSFSILRDNAKVKHPKE